MKRKMIKIDEAKCDGCGLCSNACHEGAIGIVRGKARLLRDDYCDGMGDCLPACPQGAITFEEREAADFNGVGAPKARNWPIQIKLTGTQSPTFRGRLTVAADCVGFRGSTELGSPLLIGCPKLDGIDYSDKLAQIVSGNPITGITVHRMSVPCCSGLVRMVESAVEKSGKQIPVEIIVTEVN
ncbi:MAG: 4Fe-4S binding protein [Oscillospiraceae bacterium]|jgi:NAD-dependent dihydropyrimidine dehydrogenase PreA subunit|nr:4Fe-4S binding protein [Oscillospiraceae bacterium]